MRNPTQSMRIAGYRQRMKRLGVVRVEVQVRQGDAPLLRKIAAALSDPHRAAETRALLRQQFGELPVQDAKALLAAAPLEGIDLERPRDFGRDVDF